MTDMPQSDQTSETTGQGSQGEAPPTFRPYVLPPAPAARSRRSLVCVGLSVVVVIAGLVLCSGEPAPADAENATVHVSKMTARQLADKASLPAAKELVRRMNHGTEAEHAAASAVVNRPQSPRLRRNLVMAMALETQQRAHANRARYEREARMAEEGY